MSRSRARRYSRSLRRLFGLSRSESDRASRCDVTA
jgi:hypothetical protein